MTELSVDSQNNIHRALSSRGHRLPPQPPSRHITVYQPTPQNSPRQELPQQELPQPSGSERKRWVSCCLETDRQAVIYFGQLFFSFSVLTFCCVMLYTADGDCNRSSPYIGLISFLLGKLLSAVTDSSHT